MIIHEYHKFTEEPDEYQYSRTFQQFVSDLKRFKEDGLYHVIRFDDGHVSQLGALEIAREYGFNVAVGITTDFVGKEGYMTWEQVNSVRALHTLCNHSVSHQHMDDWTLDQVVSELNKASEAIEYHTGKIPRYYLPTYNLVNENIKMACEYLGLEVLDPVEIMYNTTP